MLDRFFQGGGKKRKRSSSEKGSSRATSKSTAPSQLWEGTDELEDDSNIDNLVLRENDEDVDSDEDNERETAAQKRLRIAKAYIRQVEQDVAEADDEIDAEAIDRELIMTRMKADLISTSRRSTLQIADRVSDMLPLSSASVRTLKGGAKRHELSITGVCIAKPSIQSAQRPMTIFEPSKKESQPVYLYSCSKDAVIVKWDFYTGKKLAFFEGVLKPTKRLSRSLKNMNHPKVLGTGHSDQILCIDATDDGCHVVSGGRDKIICVWTVADDKLKGTLKHHRDAVSALNFRKGRTELYSASYDRTVKLWNVAEMSYIDTLFGHQDQITSLSALHRERCLTSGSRDRTMRLWKTAEESQLVYRASVGASFAEQGEDAAMIAKVGRKRRRIKEGEQGGSLDVVCMLNEEHFVTGSDSGTLSLWNINRKKPVFTILHAHGSKPGKLQSDCNWITALASLHYSDLFASGSCDNVIRLWRVDLNFTSFRSIGTIEMHGFINAMQFFYAPDVLEKPTGGASALHLLVGTGAEHRLGRWWSLKAADLGVKGGVLNGVHVVRLGVV
ncbi:pre-rRNA processing protein [Gonapodya sp. JEL0774]|nr:pre-rRNA processing protein [Gonapodya sp. JEL0774]